MKFKVITPIATEPVTLADARLHLRIDAGDTSEDDLITALTITAREVAEHYTGRALAPQTLEAALDAFPSCRGEIELPMPPVTAITSIKYTDQGGIEQTMDASLYSLSTYGDSRRVAPVYGQEWPLTQCIGDAVRVRFTTGYTALPKAVKAAMLLLIGHLYENRQEIVTDARAVAVQMPMGAAALLDTVKVWAV
jgi:uncharacterized phiE125 gp8 family phage protein